MGIKELKHLKKSLTDIESKSSQLEKSKNVFSELKKQLSDVRNQSSRIKKDISELIFSIQEQQFKLDTSDKLTKVQEIELKKIKKEISTINLENKMAGKTNKLPKYDFIEYWAGKDNPLMSTKFHVWLNFGINIPGLLFLAILTFAEALGNPNSETVFVLAITLPHILSLLIYIILYSIMVSDWKSKTADSKTIEKLAKLRDKQRPLDRIAVKFRTNNNELKRLMRDLRVHESLRDNHESSILDFHSKISITEQEIENYTESIEETYDSIKHLIPYSEYL